MARLMPLETETKLRAQLGRFGFGADRAEVAVGKLSGGEKARLLFALMSREAPHVLILDEPTNHLDIDSRQALIQALGEFEGGGVDDDHLVVGRAGIGRSEEHTSELQSLMRISYAVFCLNKNKSAYTINCNQTPQQ